MSSMASALTSVAGGRIPLCDVDIAATLQDLLAEVAVTQTYRNDEPVGIEAVYTLPLPLDAVLLGLEVEIGGRVLKGVVIGKKAAAEKYEDAVEMVDAAVMLEVLEPGLYTMNVGNLSPGETAKITFRYAMLYRWTGDSLRFFLPTTVAPRYGGRRMNPTRRPTTRSRWRTGSPFGSRSSAPCAVRSSRRRPILPRGRLFNSVCTPVAHPALADGHTN